MGFFHLNFVYFLKYMVDVVIFFENFNYYLSVFGSQLTKFLSFTNKMLIDK